MTISSTIVNEKWRVCEFYSFEKNDLYLWLVPIQNNVNNQNLYNPYRFDANKKNDGENQKSAFISYPLLQNQSQTIYLKPYPLPQQPIDNIRKKIVDQTVRENKSSSTNKQNVAVKKEVNKNQNNNKVYSPTQHTTPSRRFHSIPF